MKQSSPFQSFIWAGYECTYAKVADNRRLDQLSSTKHDQYIENDYTLLADVGISVVREGLAWHQIDLGGGRFDFSRFFPILQTAKAKGVQQIWDLNHFDFPEYLDPFSADFVSAFREFAKRAIAFLRTQIVGTIYIVPFNEISFFSWIAAEQGLWAPYAKDSGLQMKKQLVRATLAAMDAIWQEDQDVRFIQVDPLLYRRAKKPITSEARKMVQAFAQARFQAWDMLSGKLSTELGGAPKYLDIVGINYYPQNQEWILPGKNQDGGVEYEMIPWQSKYRQSFSTMLKQVYARYKRPIVVSETGGWGKLRTKFFRRTLREVDAAIKASVPILGVCVYPTVDRADWFDDHLVNSGLWDFMEGDPSCQRIPHKPSIEILRKYGHQHPQRDE